MSAMRVGFQQTVALRHRAIPHMGQSMRMLQMGRVELDAAIAQELLENPLLEVDEDQVSSEDLLDEPINASESDDFEVEESLSDKVFTAEPPSLSDGIGRLDPNESIELEIEWDDELAHLTDRREVSDFDTSAVLENRAKSNSLSDHLHDQLRLSNCSETEVQIAEIVFECLNEDGYITLSDDALLTEVRRSVACTRVDLEDTLVLLQGFSPLGVCARNVRECLTIQARAEAGTDHRARIAMLILRDAFDALVRRQHQEVADALGLNRDEVDSAIAFIEHLNPRPASSFALENAEYLKPEARVRKVGDRWQVEMLDDQVPSLKISDWYGIYRRMLGRKSGREKSGRKTGRDREFLQQCHNRAKLFLSSLRFRNFNVMRIVTVVVEKQQAFFDRGDGALRPLLLADVADEVGLHNSTVSRLTTGKYLETPRGMYELKYFFANRVGNQPGKEHSGIAIRSILRDLIQAEDPRRPLSDQEITTQLKDRDIQISRRTVAKYRESLAIPASKKRRRGAVKKDEILGIPA